MEETMPELNRSEIAEIKKFALGQNLNASVIRSGLTGLFIGVSFNRPLVGDQVLALVANLKDDERLRVSETGVSLRG